MSQDRIHGLLELAQLRLLLCTDPVRAEKIAAEIHGLKAKLFESRKRSMQYRDRHLAFQRTGVGQ